jgi:hypothetical protein
MVKNAEGIMLHARLGSVLRAATLIALAVLGSTGPAQAAVYKTSWDPAYGSPFANLGWNGAAEFYVPDACVNTLGGWGYEQLSSGSCVGMKAGTGLGPAKANLYTLPTVGTNSETLTYSPFDILEADYLDGELIGVDSVVSAYLPSTQESAGGADFALRFFNILNTDETPVGGSVELRYLRACPSDNSEFSSFSIEYCSGVNTEPVGKLTFTLVPEPPTYALMIAALGAVGFITRRRRR